MNKMLNLYNYKKLERIENNGIRFYDTQDGYKLPSVTTILSYGKDTSFLDQWRERVGDDEAKRITEEAQNIGTHLHSNLENFLLDKPERTGPLISKMFADTIIRKGLKHVTEIWGIEATVYYPQLFAGTTDLVGKWKHKPAIIDYKNARRAKKDEWVEDYKLQLCAYGEAHNALFGTNIETGVILMMSREGAYQEFVIEGSEYHKYKDMWLERVYNYYKNTL
jgi:genome maintenance exonuclease 1